jgi:hypothetical protein
MAFGSFERCTVRGSTSISVLEHDKLQEKKPSLARFGRCYLSRRCIGSNGLLLSPVYNKLRRSCLGLFPRVCNYSTVRYWNKN